ncbi:MAG: HNH endonuclease [Frankiaceae bacterium]
MLETRRTNADAYRERDRDRYQRDKPKRIALVAEAGHRRRALLASVPRERGITVAALIKRDGDLCHWCRCRMTTAPAKGHVFVPSKATIEHVLPLSRGGGHVWANVVLACWQCNVRKNAKTEDEWTTAPTANRLLW